MKETQVKSFFDDLINSPEKFSEFSEMIEKSLGFFEQVVKDLKTASPEEREKINKVIKDVESNLNSEFDQICDKLGVSKSEIQKVIADPKNFKPEEWSMLQDFQNKLDNEAKKEGYEGQEKPKAKKKTKSKKWLSA
ncbi:MAG: hypothetical protein JXA94_00545 [Parachlamydiales bacterium]|nr:hypothetical protein [Parachlamydiales bacterium]